jgi:AraC-like DNA-binding protein
LRSRPDLRLTEVAALSGFGGNEQLHRAFRFVVGMTPGAYRMAATGGGEQYAATILDTASETRLGRPVSGR